MHAHNTLPTYDPDFQNPHPDYPPLQSYNEPAMSNDLAQADYGSTNDPFASTSLPVSSPAQYFDASLAPAWPQGYPPYSSDQQTHFVQSTPMPGYQWQSHGYPAAPTHSLQGYNQTFIPNLPVQLSAANVAYHGAAGMPTVQTATPAQYHSEIAMGQSHPAQWSANMVEQPGSNADDAPE
ncbi:hypothetical protein EVJ58_g202 [Rhodofomes roseus]|uniref:Uncharacterized protein n=1 Tax=Rhodofomes roseus TaxID=34475 RepID=A0A4Y9Z8Z6_9APHY|nr:hypothetical protein EVJ58_g202 [Rhodofomes roseus]